MRRAAAAWQALVDESLALSQQGDVSDRIGFLEHQLQLGDLASLLVEIHGQHEQQALLTRPSQLALLDA
ncbi:hypothetical protein C7E17_27355, partial [Stenotrophomonas maltophilia]